MRLQALAIALFAALAPGNTGAQPETDRLIPFFKGEVVLDGRLHEYQWRRALTITEAGFRLWKADTYDKDPSRFRLRLFHDGTALYVSIASYDRFVEAGEPPENSDGLYSFSVVAADGGLQHYRLRWSDIPVVAGGEMLTLGKWGARLRGPFNDPDHEGGGYLLEFRISFKSLGRRPGDTLPVNVILQDHDGKPGGRYNEPGVEFARYFLGSMDNERRSGFLPFRLAEQAR